MEALLLYFGKIILCSGVMFLYYQLSLKDKTFHHYNRFYLLSAILISLLLPLIKIEDFTIEVSNEMYLLLGKIKNFNTEKNLDNGNLYFNIIFSALGLVSLYFLGKLIYGIIKIQQFKEQFHKESFDGINFYRTNLTEAPFSYFKNLFWKNTITLDSEIGKQILKHEMVHIEQKHSFDRILIEVVTAVFWFNPFFHIIKKEISLIHEYQADQKAVKHSDTKAFAQMLLASHFSGTQLAAASPFLSSNLKKRLKMLQKPRTKFGYARRILALPVLFTVAFAYLVNAKNKEIEETNLSIKKAVSEIKKDTVSPEKAEQKKITEPGSLSPKEEERLAELDKKIKEKERELDGLNPDSEEFNKKIEEISSMAAEIGSITAEIEVDAYFKSDEWKKQMKDLENMDPLSPQEIKKIKKEAEKAAKEGAKAAREASKAGKEAEKAAIEGAKAAREASKVGKEAEKAAIEGAKAAIEASRASKAGKEAAKIARETAKIGKVAAEQARIEFDKTKKESDKAKVEAEEARQEADNVRRNFKNINFTAANGSPKTMVLQADFIKKDGNGNITMNGVKRYDVRGWEEAKYFLNGKEVSKAEALSIKPENIESMNIMKENKVRGTQNEIRIQTKK
ncbi:M56 family metallopeptidase [Chryseobacterium sp. c4a]|uniref:M56 family metallopeptidase n=1 Tax=Chryseobacterium sp. c4a TaxID=1573582 RepID=UPI00135A66F7|nr:M56 family metallopeptidase [Chryseobacterium sp. c4a]